MDVVPGVLAGASAIMAAEGACDGVDRPVESQRFKIELRGISSRAPSPTVLKPPDARKRRSESRVIFLTGFGHGRIVSRSVRRASAARKAHS